MGKVGALPDLSRSGVSGKTRSRDVRFMPNFSYRYRLHMMNALAQNTYLSANVLRKERKSWYTTSPTNGSKAPKYAASFIS